MHRPGPPSPPSTEGGDGTTGRPADAPASAGRRPAGTTTAPAVPHPGSGGDGGRTSGKGGRGGRSGRSGRGGRKGGGGDAGPGRERERRSRRRPTGGIPLVLLIPGALTALFALLPMVYLAVRALERGPEFAWNVVAAERTGILLSNSLRLTAVVVAATLLLGVSLAWLTERTALPAPRFWGVLAALPLAVPSYVMSFSWLSAFPAVQGFTGAAIALSLACFPYVYLPVAAVLRGIDPAQEETARSLGHSAFGAFRRVTLPQLRPAAAGGGLLVALYVMSDFGAVSLMRYDTFTRAIHTSYRASFDRTPAAALGCVLVLITVLLVLAERRTRGRARYAKTGRGAARPATRLPLGPWARGAALGWSGLVALAALAFPIGTLCYWISVGNSATWQPGMLWQTAWSTISVAAAGALVTAVLALPIAVLAARYRSWPARLLEQASFAGHALPGITVALAFVFLAVRYAQPIYQEWPLLVLAYAALFLPLAVTTIRAAVLQAPEVLEETARSLGRGPLRTLREVTLPLAAPGIATGIALTFVVIMKELPVTLLLRPTGMETLATRIWTHTGNFSFAAAAPYALTLVLIAAIPSYLLGRHRS